MKIGPVLRLAEDLLAGDAPNRRCPSYAEIRDAAQQMEGAAFDSICLADHLLYRRPGVLPRLGHVLPQLCEGPTCSEGSRRAH